MIGEEAFAHCPSPTRVTIPDTVERIERRAFFDINSGMNGDTGEAELAVISDLTVSIGRVKKGQLQKHARELIGKLAAADIGIEFP